MPEDEFKSQVDSEEIDREEEDDEEEDLAERDETAVFERDHFDKLAHDVSDKRPIAAKPEENADCARNPAEGGSHFKTILKELEESVSEDEDANANKSDGEAEHVK